MLASSSPDQAHQKVTVSAVPKSVSGAIKCGIINLQSDYAQVSSESASSQIKPLEEKQVNKVRDGYFWC
jgi:hypothetical protein